ncbi:MAG: hypothetical protein JO115_07830 [Pseudonocardiales bacterium]|nr:hypothetical protein [Pseudonocardiales bacterium]
MIFSADPGVSPTQLLRRADASGVDGLDRAFADVDHSKNLSLATVVRDLLTRRVRP